MNGYAAIISSSAFDFGFHIVPLYGHDPFKFLGTVFADFIIEISM